MDVLVTWIVMTVDEFNGSCLVDHGHFPPAPPEFGLMVVGTARIMATGRELTIAGGCPLWRNPDSIIEEEFSPELDAMLDEEVGPLRSKVVVHG